MKTVFALLLSSLMILVVACSKDDVATKPRIEIKDYTATVSPGGQLRITLNYFDKEGDIDSIYGLKIRLNNFPPIGVPEYLADVFDYPIFGTDGKSTGEIAFTLNYTLLNESVTQNDTIRFKFAVKDRERNFSDTITTEQIVVLNE